ncbi:MAG: M20/M25/M40 family metallo-hydrolase [Firmicutes bacterium]|nr:M20/M25/M40 family metallo-hydrolase [Bacillota bacterium]
MVIKSNSLASVAGTELRRLLEISSVSGDETEILAYLEKRCREMGFRTEHQEVIGVRYNLLVNPLPEPGLIITVHTDTVPDEINGSTCRYEIDGERFYGRGAADVKGGTAALLAAMDELFHHSYMKDSGMPPITFAFTVDEEREGRGSEELARLGGHAAVVIEPTDLKICTAQSGSVIMQLRVYGRSAHGGEFESGYNAALRAMDMLEKIDRLPVLNRRHRLAGHGGYNLQMINAGSREMAVPRQCDLLLDFRVLPDEEPADVQTAVDNLINKYDGVDSKWLEVSGAYQISETEPIVNLMQSCYKEALHEEPCLGAIHSWTDAENLNNAGTKSLVFGPGNLALSHTEEEYVDLPEVVKAAQVFTSLISRSHQLKQ